MVLCSENYDFWKLSWGRKEILSECSVTFSQAYDSKLFCYQCECLVLNQYDDLDQDLQGVEFSPRFLSSHSSNSKRKEY